MGKKDLKMLGYLIGNAVLYHLYENHRSDLDSISTVVMKCVLGFIRENFHLINDHQSLITKIASKYIFGIYFYKIREGLAFVYAFNDKKKKTIFTEYCLFDGIKYIEDKLDLIEDNNKLKYLEDLIEEWYKDPKIDPDVK